MHRARPTPGPGLLAETSADAARRRRVITWPALEHAVQGRPGWRRIGHEWHGPCPVTGGGRDCCWFGPGHGADVRGGCRACGGRPRCRSLPGPPGRADWPDPRRPFEYSGASRCQPGISRSWERGSIARVVGCARHPRYQTVRGWDAMKVMATQCKTCIYRGDKPPPPRGRRCFRECSQRPMNWRLSGAILLLKGHGGNGKSLCKRLSG